MKERIEGYGILITRTDGTAFFASGKEHGCFIAKKRREAVERKQALSEHISGKRMKVVKVAVTWELL
jgi:ribosomal protein L24E